MDIKDEIKSLIIGTCNIVGCDNCTMKWEKDSDGNTCRYDYLEMLMDKEKDNQVFIVKSQK